jgi:hypothetical protein
MVLLIIILDNKYKDTAFYSKNKLDCIKKTSNSLEYRNNVVSSPPIIN